MSKKQLKANIRRIDEEVAKLHNELIHAEDDETYDGIIERIEKLTELRCKLTESKVSDSYTKEILSGAIGIASMVLVLHYEKADAITSKAFNMVTQKFRG